MIKTLAEALEAQGYDTLTPVQQAVTDDNVGASDLLVSAQTGSGKTVGFGLAIAPTMLQDAERFGRAGAPLGLVIAPTRELALQVKRELSWLYGPAGAVVASCVGGMDPRDERRALDRGTHVVVATPGRLRDHIQRGSLDLSDIKAIVLDEADEMLDLGFREDLEFILGEAPEDRRTLLFSATVPPAIATLAKQFQRDAVRVSLQASGSQHADIDYRALSVAPRDEEHALINVLRYHDARVSIVFANTRAMVTRLTTRLSNRGFAVVALSGELSQTERSNALQSLRDGRANVCVATDVAARGLDLPNLELVVHAELPSNSDTLLHRSGRTGRAGRKGTSVLIVPPKSRKKAERLLSWAKLQAEWAAPPSAEDVRKRDQERLLADPAWAEAAPESARELIDLLVEKFSVEQLASAFVRLHQDHKAPPEDLSAVGAGASTSERPNRVREEFGPSRWYSLSLGRKDNAEARWVLPLICRTGNLDRDAIGAIRIRQDETFVEIRESAAAGLEQAIGPDRVLEDGAILTALDTPPDLSNSDRSPSQGGAKRSYKDRDDKSYKPSTPRPPRPAGDGPRKAPAWKSAPKDHDGAVTPRAKKAYGDKPTGDRPARPFGDKPTKSWGEKPSKPRGEKTYGDKPSKPRGEKTYGDKPSKPRGDKTYGDKPSKPRGEKTYGDKPSKPFGDKSAKKPGKPFAAGKSAASANASDTSKRMAPPKSGGKPAGAGTGPRKVRIDPARGGDAVPRKKRTPKT